MSTDPGWMTWKAVHEQWGISRWTLTRAMDEGQLPARSIKKIRGRGPGGQWVITRRGLATWLVTHQAWIGNRKAGCMRHQIIDLSTLTAAEDLVEQLGCTSVRHVKDLIRRHSIEHIRVGPKWRLTPAQVTALVQAMQVTGARSSQTTAQTPAGSSGDKLAATRARVIARQQRRSAA